MPSILGARVWGSHVKQTDLPSAVPGVSLAKTCSLKKWAGREVAVFFIKEDQKILKWKPWQKTLSPWTSFRLNLDDVFEKIYVEHNTTPTLKYTLNATAKEVFFKFSKPYEDDSQGAVASPSNSSGSKKYKNTLLVALNMHVLYHRHLPWSQGQHPQQ